MSRLVTGVPDEKVFTQRRWGGERPLPWHEENPVLNTSAHKQTDKNTGKARGHEH